MSRLSIAQLVDRLRETDRCMFVSLRALTVPNLNKTGNPYFGHVLKVVSASGAINYRYARVVNRQRMRESRPANFKAKPRRWGTKLQCCPLVEHTTADGHERVYLDFKVQTRTDRFIDRRTGQEISTEELQPWLPAASRHRQGVERRVAIRDFRMDRIAELTIEGQRLQVTPTIRRLQRLLKKGTSA